MMSLLTEGMRTVKIKGPDRAFLLLIRYLSWKSRYHDRVRQLPPTIARPIVWFTIQWVRFIVRLFNRRYPQKYTAEDPYTIYYIDPSKISNISKLHDRKRRGWVIDGDWDKRSVSFTDRPLPRSIIDHYQDGVPWNKTPLAAEYDDEHLFRQKCKKIERLYKSIEQDGLRLQRELANDTPRKTWKNANATISPFTNEITVDIGRDGEILWNMLGKHRLSIAKALELEQVPVMVFSRHPQWELNSAQIPNTGEVY